MNDQRNKYLPPATRSMTPEETGAGRSRRAAAREAHGLAGSTLT